MTSFPHSLRRCIFYHYYFGIFSLEPKKSFFLQLWISTLKMQFITLSLRWYWVDELFYNTTITYKLILLLNSKNLKNLGLKTFHSCYAYNIVEIQVYIETRATCIFLNNNILISQVKFNFLLKFAPICIRGTVMQVLFYLSKSLQTQNQTTYSYENKAN